MQTGDFPSSWQCLQQTWRHEGVRGLFAGISSPMVSSIIFSAILFGSYENFKEFYSTVRAVGFGALYGRGARAEVNLHTLL